MTDLLRQGSDWLEDQRTRFASRPVTYQRQDMAIEVLATVGKTVFELDDGAGAVVRTESRDYLILAGDLTLGLPQRGDRIRETEGQQVFVYEVTAPGNEPHWRYSDPYRRTLRVHTKQIDVEATP